MCGRILSSQEMHGLKFPDGGGYVARGLFDSSSGMCWHGMLAKAWILCELGFDPRRLLKRETILMQEGFRRMLLEQKAIKNAKSS